MFILFFPGGRISINGAGKLVAGRKILLFPGGTGRRSGNLGVARAHSFFRRRPKCPTRLASGLLHFGSPLPSIDGKRLFVFGEDPRVELLRYDLKGAAIRSLPFQSFSRPIDYSSRWELDSLYFLPGYDSLA